MVSPVCTRHGVSWNLRRESRASAWGAAATRSSNVQCETTYKKPHCSTCQVKAGPCASSQPSARSHPPTARPSCKHSPPPYGPRAVNTTAPEL
eukprot:1021915-Rhodomonas_salina.1